LLRSLELICSEDVSEAGAECRDGAREELEQVEDEEGLLVLVVPRPALGLSGSMAWPRMKERWLWRTGPATGPARREKSSLEKEQSLEPELGKTDGTKWESSNFRSKYSNQE
jgi:hypothetical protein